MNWKEIFKPKIIKIQKHKLPKLKCKDKNKRKNNEIEYPRIVRQL